MVFVSTLYIRKLKLSCYIEKDIDLGSTKWNLNSSSTIHKKWVSVSRSVTSDYFRPWTHGSSVHGIAISSYRGYSPPESKLGLLQRRRIFYHQSLQGSPNLQAYL